MHPLISGGQDKVDSEDHDILIGPLILCLQVKVGLFMLGEKKHVLLLKLAEKQIEMNQGAFPLCQANIQIKINFTAKCVLSVYTIV